MNALNPRNTYCFTGQILDEGNIEKTPFKDIAFNSLSLIYFFLKIHVCYSVNKHNLPEIIND
jgi:hypothetical protein